MHELAAAAPEFPQAMQRLVAAGIVVEGQARFEVIGRNVRTTAESYVHAEEVAIGGLSVADAPIHFVVTEEPCLGRTDEQTACADRILAVAATRPIRRVVVGAVANGEAIKRFAAAGIRVQLLHGPEHGQLLSVNEHLRDPTLLVAEINDQFGAGAVELIADCRLDSLNRRCHTRLQVRDARCAELIAKALHGAEASWARADRPAIVNQVVKTLQAEWPGARLPPDLKGLPAVLEAYRFDDWEQAKIPVTTQTQRLVEVVWGRIQKARILRELGLEEMS